VGGYLCVFFENLLKDEYMSKVDEDDLFMNYNEDVFVGTDYERIRKSQHQFAGEWAGEEGKDAGSVGAKGEGAVGDKAHKGSSSSRNTVNNGGVANGPLSPKSGGGKEKLLGKGEEFIGGYIKSSATLKF
jgi:hypothetical protein